MGRKKSMIPGFSLNRALGISSAKQVISRATGIPTTKQGRKRKMQSTVWTAVAVGTAAAISKSGKSDSVNDQTLLDESESQHQENVQNQKPPKKPSMLVPIILLLVGFIMFSNGLYLPAIIFPIISLISASKNIKKTTGQKVYRVRSFQIIAFFAIFPIFGSVITGILQNMPSEKHPDMQPEQSIQQEQHYVSDDGYYIGDAEEDGSERYYKNSEENPNEKEVENRIETDGIATYVFHSGSEQTTQSINDDLANTYILNINTKIFHRENCSSAQRISAENKETFYGTRSSIIESGYSPCEICDP